MRRGMAPSRRQATGLQSVFYVYFSISMAYSYNIDLEHPLVFRGPNNSFFGYSVLEHYHDNTRWWVPFSNIYLFVYIRINAKQNIQHKKTVLLMVIYTLHCARCHVCRVIVGAPKANSTYSSSAHSPGSVYKCRVHSNPDRRCTEMDLGRGQSPPPAAWTRERDM